MSPWQRRLRNGGIACLAGSLILLGVLVGLFRIAVQVAPGYRQDLASWVEQLIGSPVAIANMDLAWRGWYPTLILSEVIIGAGSGDFVQLDEMQLGFAIHRIALADPVPARVVLIGPEITLIRTETGLQLEGVGATGVAGGASGLANRLLDIGEVQVRNATLVWDDRAHGLPLKFLRDVELRARQHAIGFRVELLGVAVDQGRVRGSAVFPTLEFPPQRLQLRLENWFPWAELRSWVTGLPPVLADISLLEIDAFWRGDQFVTASGSIALSHASLESAAEPGVQQLSGRFRAERRGPATQLDFDDLEIATASGAWPASALSLDLQPIGDEHWRIGFDASYLRLADLHYWLPLLPEASAAPLLELAPGGELRDLVGHWETTDPLPVLSARFERLAWAPVGQRPGVEGLSGTLVHEGRSGHATIDSQVASLLWPEVFTRPLPFASAIARLEWQALDAGWTVSSRGFRVDALGLDAGGDFQFHSGPEPTIELSLDLATADPIPWLQYQPLFWGAGLREWLLRAVRKARVPGGHIVLRGPLREFPWTEGNGQFLVNLDLADIDLEYARGWPQLRNADLQLQISGKALEIGLQSGEFHGAAIERGTARKLLEPRAPLLIEADATGDARDLFGVLKDSPLRRRFAELIANVAVTGPARVHADLEVPLWDVDNTRFEGRAQLEGVRLTTPHWPEPVRNIRGVVDIGADGLAGRGIVADMERQRFVVDLTPNAGWTELAARGQFALAKHGRDWGVPDWLSREASGSSEVRVAMRFGPGDVQPIVIRSDLVGTALSFPQPFGKAADAATAVEIRIEAAPDGGRWLRCHYGALLDSRVLFSAGGKGPERTHLRLGGEPAPDPVAPGLWVDGQVPTLDFAQWYQFFRDMGGEGEDMRFGGMVLSAERVDAFGQLMENLRLQLTADASDWTLSLSGADAQGTINWPRRSADARGVVRGRFGRLHWGWELAEDHAEPIDPRLFPALELAVDNLILNDQPLGRVQMQLRPLADGIAVADLKIGDADSPQLELTGDWLRDERGSRGRFDFGMNTTRFQSWLAALGYEENIRAARARVSGHLEWPPDPRGLTVDAVSGELSVNLSNGQILAVEPGAGRMLGLLSFNALPRRFFLDFRDVVDSGLGFDKVAGQFQIADGDAFTEGLSVEGPSLKVNSRGRVGLAARDYDQTITIYPSISSGVTLAATVLGGPAVGLFTLFAQELFGKPLDQATQISYHLGGSWENPQVTKTP